ncbi:hypothetical protein C8R45DRAFT_628995 [Mycena sanguinolenta]|nr:hypothetical protein C8R45DRAFT_628995 [Mycena sanguinolenta]
MIISLFTAPRDHTPPGAHRRHSALSDTIVGCTRRLELGHPVQSLDGMPSILCEAPRSHSCASRWRGVVAFFRAAGVIVGESASSVSTASIRHPSPAPDIYGTLRLLSVPSARPPSTLSCPSPIDYSNTWFRGSVDRRAGCASFASSGCAFDRATFVWPLESSTTTLSTPNSALARIYWSSRGQIGFPTSSSASASASTPTSSSFFVPSTQPFAPSHFSSSTLTVAARSSSGSWWWTPDDRPLTTASHYLPRVCMNGRSGPSTPGSAAKTTADAAP